MTELPPEGLHAVFSVEDESLVTDEIRAERQRNKRNRLLVESDWTQVGDDPTGNKEAWATYRQALRDLPADPAWPYVEFPEVPA